MKDLLKTFKYETFKILFNKKKLLYLVFVLVLFLISCYLIKNLLTLTKYTGVDSYEINVKLRDTYKWQYEYAYGISDYIPEDVMLPHNFHEMKESYYEKYLYYDYLVNTRTDSNDYVKIDNLFGSKAGLENGVFQLLMAKLSFFIMGIISIIVSMNICFNEIDINYYKNIHQIEKNEIKLLKNKIIISLFSILIINIMYVLVVYLFSFDKVDYCLVLSNNSYIKVSTFNYFISSNIVTLSYSIFLCLMTIFFRLISKKTINAIFKSIKLIALIFGVYIIITKIINGSTIVERIKKYFIFVNTQSNDIIFTNIYFYCIIMFNMVLSFILFGIILKRHKIDKINY